MLALKRIKAHNGLLVGIAELAYNILLVACVLH